jgi:4-hydroxy-3-methylbut-2-enyl diphosphate reductase
VRAIARRATLVLVVGSTQSSNAHRLVEVAWRAGAHAALLDGEAPLPGGLLEDHVTVGLTGAASTPEQLVARTLDRLRRAGYRSVEEVGDPRESAHFKLPHSLAELET